MAKRIADRVKSDEIFLDQSTHFVFGHNACDFNDGQMKTICAFRDKLIEKHLKLNGVALAILDDDDKNLFFMWGKIKHEYPKEAELTWLKAKAAKTCCCSKQDVKNILIKIEKLGAIKMLQIG